MWTRFILGRRTMRGTVLAALLAVGAGLGSAGCTASYVTNSTAPVILGIPAINKGDALNSDVRQGDSQVKDDLVTVTVVNRPKNPNFTSLPQVAMAIIIERYEVSYYRSDGRGTEGVDVPYRISGNLTTSVDVSTTTNVDINIPVVRAQAKLEPPLINLWGTTSGTLGGTALLVTMFAKVTLSGHTVAGQAVEGSGNLQINFADFPDSST